jgi:hypothetical protein
MPLTNFRCQLPEPDDRRIMTTVLARAGYILAGALLTVLLLYSTLKETSREQKFGLLMSPEEVKLACGTPQVDDVYRLSYVDGDKRVDLQFMSVNHRMFLNHVKWNSSKASRLGISTKYRWRRLPTL